MRTLRLGLLGLLCVLGLLALPLTARAAPALTLTPATTPAGVPVTIAGTGFPANAALVFYVKDQTGTVVDDPTARGNITVKGDGTFQATVTPTADAPPGRYDIIVATSMTAPELARATLTLTSPHGEAITVAPTTGPVGTQFAVAGTGFEANARLLVVAFLANTNNPAAPPTPVTIGADGQFRATIASTGFTPGTYQVFVARSENDPILATAIFTVTAATTPTATVSATPTTAPTPTATVPPTPTTVPTPAPMPGLPNTGGGGTSATTGATLPAALLLAALLTLGIIAMRRYGKPL